MVLRLNGSILFRTMALDLKMMSTKYFVSAFIVFHNGAMRTIHAVLDTGAGPTLGRSHVLPIIWGQNVIISAPFPHLGDDMDRPLQLLGIVILRLRIFNSHFRGSFIVPEHPVASMLIGTEFLDRPVV